jgi:hypothetical protein
VHTQGPGKTAGRSWVHGKGQWQSLHLGHSVPSPSTPALLGSSRTRTKPPWLSIAHRRSHAHSWARGRSHAHRMRRESLEAWMGGLGWVQGGRGLKPPAPTHLLVPSGVADHCHASTSCQRVIQPQESEGVWVGRGGERRGVGEGKASRWGWGVRHVTHTSTATISCMHDQAQACMQPRSQCAQAHGPGTGRAQDPSTPRELHPTCQSTPGRSSTSGATPRESGRWRGQPRRSTPTPTDAHWCQRHHRPRRHRRHRRQRFRGATPLPPAPPHNTPPGLSLSCQDPTARGRW